MLICRNCVSIISEVNFPALVKINSLMNTKRSDIINDFVYSKRVKEILLELNMSQESFKAQYAVRIYEFFYNFTRTDIFPGFCPTAIDFLKEIIHYEDCSKAILLLCTQFKNSVLSIFTSKDLMADFSEQEIKEMYNSMATLLDLNLSQILQEYSAILQKKEKEIFEHSKLIEEETIASKTDIDGKITFVSDSFVELSGYTREELLGSTHKILRHPDFSSKVYEKLWQRITMGFIWKGRIRNLSKSGKEFTVQTTIIPQFDETGLISGYIAIRNDLTDKLKSKTDNLTGIMNREQFNESLTKAIDDFKRFGRKFSLIFVDLDNFKHVNDTFGHIAGDDVLKKFSSIVLENIRSNDTFARWGGEEFILIFQDLAFDVVLTATERIRKAIEGTEFGSAGRVTASFGIVEYVDESLSIDEIVNLSDKCLYHSKKSGRNMISYFEDGVYKTTADI